LVARREEIRDELEDIERSLRAVCPHIHAHGYLPIDSDPGCSIPGKFICDTCGESIKSWDNDYWTLLEKAKTRANFRWLDGTHWTTTD
jgi:hypothetical protein